MLIIGGILLGWSWRQKILFLRSALAVFPIVASITAAYLWIRLDVWRDDKTIRELVKPEVIQNELLSRRSDSRVAIILLVLVAIAQSFFSESKSNWSVFFGMLLVLVPICNWIARRTEKRSLLNFNKNR